MTQVCLYLLFVFVSLMFFFSKERTKNILLPFCFCICLIVIVTFRPSEMADYIEYKTVFTDLSLDIRFEPLFFLIRYIASFFPYSYLIGFLLFALIAIILKFRCLINNNYYIWASIAVFFSHTLVTQEMVAIRAAVSGSFFLLAVEQKIKRCNYKMLLSLLASFMFHYSGFIFFLLYFISETYIRRKLYLILIVVSYIFALYGIYITNHLLALFESILGNNVLYVMYKEDFQNNEVYMNIFNILQLFRLVLCVLLWINVDKIFKRGSQYLIYLKFYTIGVCIFPLFSNSIAISTRMSDLLMVTEIFLLPVGFFTFFKRERVAKFFLIAYSSLSFILVMSDKTYWNPS